LTGEHARPRERENAVDLKVCHEQRERSHFDAEIRASDVSAFHFRNSFARSSQNAKRFMPPSTGITVPVM
jgi:hypothetical protein